MWTRQLLKTNARSALSGRYWRGFWVCLLVSLASGGAFTIKNNVDTVRNNVDTVRGGYDYSFMYGMPDETLALILGIALLVFVLSCVWQIFVLGPLNVGLARYFMESRQALAPFGTVMGIFRTPYLNVVKVSFLTELKIALGCLLVIPGIYWSYCYTLVPFLLAENPYMTTRRAMELSKAIMEGEKWNYFVLMLSFIGWYLLCGVTMGIGTFFLAPYINATQAEFYAAMRSKAFALGLSNAQELGGFVTHGDVVL
ncbi:DUF975 family protein [uncultured Gemmiger sp.]|uniref:DUF975 family protein n=1 Tax=uncultured Gemmiger sp. TaxID=1623490 RepID=UPI0027DAFFDC|nr:DUF975 family protein [uncultured Gemmiger sp.]